MMLSRDISLGTIQSVGSSSTEDEFLAAPNDDSAAVTSSGCVKSAPVPFNFAIFLGSEELAGLSINSSNAT